MTDDQSATRATVGRRSVLGGASVAALGISTLRLPEAARAATGAGGGSQFAVASTITHATVGMDTGPAPNRSFVHDGKRYVLDTNNYDLYEFSGTGAFLQKVGVTNPPTSVSNFSSMTVVGDYAYLPLTRTVSSTPYLSVMRVDLSSSLSGTTTVAYEDASLASTWGTRSAGGQSFSSVAFSNLTPLVYDGTSALHCILQSEDQNNAYFMDHFEFPLDFAGASPVSTELLASTTQYNTELSMNNAVAVGTYGLFIGTYQQEGSGNDTDILRVPFADPSSADWITTTLPSGLSSISIYEGRDRSTVEAAGAFWACADATLTADDSDAVVAIRFDTGAASVTAASSPALPASDYVAIPGARWGQQSIATDGTYIYVAYEKTTPSGTQAVARITIAGPAFDSSVDIGASIPATLQGLASGVLASLATSFVRLGDVAA